MNIAVVAETAPAKTIIPIIEKSSDNILALTHSQMATDLLYPYSVETYNIGESRRNTSKKRSNFTIGKLVLQDAYRTYSAMKDKDIDLVLTCGNSGDVRKGIAAAKKLDIPKLHIEQDIYNPIELIAYANLITVPNTDARKKLKKMYGITNTVNIKGYPQAEYVTRLPLEDVDEVYKFYGSDDFYVLFLGGDTRAEDIPEIIHQTEKLSKTIIIIPYRFDVDYVSKQVTRRGVYVVDGEVDLISLMNASQGIIYCAGMGVTIEAGSLAVPAVKVMGFHKDHASNDLARSIGINVVSVYNIKEAVGYMKKPRSEQLVKNGIKASMKVNEIMHNMTMFEDECGGFNSLKRIWNQRKQYR